MKKPEIQSSEFGGNASNRNHFIYSLTLLGFSTRLLTEPAPTPEHPFLENGQLKKPLKVFELAESLRTKGNQETQQNQPNFADFFDGYFVNPYFSHAGGHFGNGVSTPPYAEHPLFKRHEPGAITPRQIPQSAEDDFTGKVKFLSNPAIGVETFAESVEKSRRRRSLNETIDSEEAQDRAGRAMFRRPAEPSSSGRKRGALAGRKRRKESQEEKRVIAKKQVILGDFGHGAYGFGYGTAPFYPGKYPAEQQESEPDDNPLNGSAEDEDSPPQPEPAEDEVRRIMSVCSGCDRDPYRKVAVISWRSTPKKLYSGALFLKARSECRHF